MEISAYGMGQMLSRAFQGLQRQTGRIFWQERRGNAPIPSAQHPALERTLLNGYAPRQLHSSSRPLVFSYGPNAVSFGTSDEVNDAGSSKAGDLAVVRLSSAFIVEAAGSLPAGTKRMARMTCKEELPWGVNANCYAYACNDPNPDVGIPPMQAGPGINSGCPPSCDAEVAGLIAGIIADSGGRASLLGGDPSNIPTPPENTYLVALLTNSVGFHFMKRDEVTQRWSWKDANHGTVKLNVMHIPTRQYVYVNNSNLNDMLVMHKNDYGWMYAQMNFQAFLSIPNEGIVVAGRPGTR